MYPGPPGCLIGRQYFFRTPACRCDDGHFYIVFGRKCEHPAEYVEFGGLVFRATYGHDVAGSCGFNVCHRLKELRQNGRDRNPLQSLLL